MVAPGCIDPVTEVFAGDQNIVPLDLRAFSRYVASNNQQLLLQIPVSFWDPCSSSVELAPNLVRDEILQELNQENLLVSLLSAVTSLLSIQLKRRDKFGQGCLPLPGLDQT